jgi:hypothetical protein
MAGLISVFGGARDRRPYDLLGAVGTLHCAPPAVVCGNDNRP